MDISNFAGKSVKFRFQSRYDEDINGGQGEGLFIDDLRVYNDVLTQGQIDELYDMRIPFNGSQT